ncbi:MAG: site-specific integrase [Gemmatimonadaceae bacterium]|nr:site-specific integrase [Gemmatimonadaceae bacterium]
MRGQGRVFRPIIDGKQIQVWHLDYGIRGRRYRESSHTTSKRDAMNQLRERIGNRKDGKIVGQPDKVTLAELKAGLEKHYSHEDNASWKRAAQAFIHLEKFFDPDCKAIAITKAMVSEYQHSRLAAGAARNTIRYEVGVLSAAFGVAVELDKLTVKPAFKQIEGGAVRTGFFEPGEFAALVLELPSDLAGLVRFLYMTGWRRGEGAGLQWAQVDWNDEAFPGQHYEPVPGPNACIRISGAQTKGGDSRTFPFAPALSDLLLARWRVRDGLRVFHRHGKAIGDFRKAWAKACTTAGLGGKLVHDLRRTAARDFRRAGVSEGVIMQLCGWSTRDMFDRYNITNADDRKRGVMSRFGGSEGQSNGKVSADLQEVS